MEMNPHNSLRLKSVRDADVAGKRVLLRASLNVPMTPERGVMDMYRLERGLPTLRHLVGRGAKVIIAGYFGRAGETIRPVANALAGLASPIPMRFYDGSIEEAASEVGTLKEGECLILENMRRFEGEEKKDRTFARSLADLADVFVNDAFAEAHRDYASNVGVTEFLPSYAGFLMEEEASSLCKALTPPKGSLAIIGGAKFETKEPLITKLLPIYERFCVGGALANDFLKARGVEMGLSTVSQIPVPPELARDPRILVEHDVLVILKEGYNRIASFEDIHPDERVVDAGPQTASVWSEKIQEAPFVLWNGPIGIYEEGYTIATDALARALSQSSARACVGGGDTLAALEKFTFDEERVFRSTGGGAMLQFLADGGTLVGIEPLRA